MIAIVGLSHHTAALALREVLAFPRESLRNVLHQMREQAGLREGLILSTCNRVELYGSATGGATPATEALLGFLARAHNRPLEEVASGTYRLEGADAVRHAFRVAAGLDSMVVGESQILGQVKEAYQLAEEAGLLGFLLSALRKRSLAAAKRVRTETGIGRNAVSVSHVAVELAQKIFGTLAGKNVLLVGAGKMSELAARRIVADGARATVMGGRTTARAHALAEALGGRAVPFEALREELAKADIVISSTGAPCQVIHREDLVGVQQARRQRPLFLIDIAVPRDIEPTAREVDGVFLYDLDDLKSVSEANLRERQKEAVAAEAIVEGEVKEFLGWLSSLDVVPLIAALRQRGDEIRRHEIDKVKKRLGPLTPEQEVALEAASAAIVNKLLHPSFVQIKELGRSGQAETDLILVRRLLGL